jgi:formate hydrogenlyase subunit 6/NADH:ubiquinone oxidoreductase subunit I
VTSLTWYLREFLRPGWIRKFLTVRTAPLEIPAHFRNFPARTEVECTHCFTCRMICPAPGAIEVLQRQGTWGPEVYHGHCIRCGLCVEACPEGVLASGRILAQQEADRTRFIAEFHIRVDPAKCMRCGNCCVACPVNKEKDPQIASGGHSANDEVIMKIQGGQHVIIHEEICTGCRTCEDTCPNSAIRVARVLQAVHGTFGEDGS